MMLLYVLILYLTCISSISLTREHDILIDGGDTSADHNDQSNEDDENFFKLIQNYTIYYPRGIVSHVSIVLKHQDDTGYLYQIDISNLQNKEATFSVNNQPCISHCDMYVALFTTINLDLSITTTKIEIETIDDVATFSVNQCPQIFKQDCLFDVDSCFCDSLKEGGMIDNCPDKRTTTNCAVQRSTTVEKTSSTMLTTTQLSTTAGQRSTTVEKTSSTLLTTTQLSTAASTIITSTTVSTTPFYDPAESLDYYDVFFTGPQVHFTLQSLYSPHTGAYVVLLQPEFISPTATVTMNSKKCDPTCTAYVNNKEPVLIGLEMEQKIGNMTIIIDNYATTLYVNDCKQTFVDRQCKTQFVPYWCVCHSKDVSASAAALCDLNIPLISCSDNTPPPSARLASYHISYGSDPFSGVFVDMLFFSGQYDFIFEVMPETNVPVLINGTICKTHCEKHSEGNTRVDLQIGSGSIFSFEAILGECIVYYDNCRQNITSMCLSDYSMICFCQTFPLSMTLDDVGQMCYSSVPFDQCHTSTTIATTPTKTTLATTVSTTPKLTTKPTTILTSISTLQPTSSTLTTKRTTRSITTLKTTQTTPTTTVTTTVPTTPFIPSLNNLTNSGVSLDNVTYVLSVTMEYTENATTLQSTDISDVSTILTNSANLEGLPSSDANLILQNIDNVLNANDDQIEKSQSQDKFLSILPTLVMNTIAAEVQYLSGNNMGFSSGNVLQTSVNGLTDQGDSFQTLNNSNLPQSHLNSIVLHSGENGVLPKGTKALFTIFRSRKFFNGQTALRGYPTYTHSFMQTNSPEELNNALDSKCLRQFQLPGDSPVMSATVIQPDGARVSKLASYNMSARLHLNTEHLLRPLHGRMIVSWWKTDVNKWSTDDLCSTENHDHLITATCDHLTDFALIVDSMVNDPVVCDSGLISVGYVVNILSLTCLSIVIFIQFSDNIPICARQRFLQRLKGPPLQKTDHMQMAHNVMLFLFYLFFLIFTNESISGKGCNFIAAVIYSLLLCSIILTIFQSLRTVILFFPTSLHNLINGLMRPFVALTLGFIIPFLLCIILAATTPFFNRQDGFCWVRPDFIVYAIVIPVSILIINGCICTALVAWRLFSAGFKFNRIGKAHDTHIKTKLLALFILQFTMGMPWVLQYPTLYHSSTTFWHYAFSIVLGSQGTILAILYFYKNHRRWRESVRLSGRDWRVRNATSHTLQTRASS